MTRTEFSTPGGKGSRKEKGLPHVLASESRSFRLEDDRKVQPEDWSEREEVDRLGRETLWL